MDWLKIHPEETFKIIVYMYLTEKLFTQIFQAAEA